MVGAYRGGFDASKLRSANDLASMVHRSAATSVDEVGDSKVGDSRDGQVLS